MDTAYLAKLVECLRSVGVEFADGLNDAEIEKAETMYGFRFPPDLRTFLQYALPISESWFNWRGGDDEHIRFYLDWPAEGICFDVEHNNFWMTEWGERPDDLEEAFAIARRHVAEAPTLIPILGHRFIPSEPHFAGNPVFSVYQTDIIHYGFDLASYFVAEFGTLVRYFNKDGVEELPTENRLEVPDPEWAAKSPRPIRFWDEIITGVGALWSEGQAFPA